MTTSTTAEMPCCASFDDDTKESLFTCNTCSQGFCVQHINESKQKLIQRLDKLVFDHEQLQVPHESCQNLSIKKIDQWECESIKKIQEMANDIRRELITELEEYNNHFSKQSKKLDEELKTSQNRGDLMEIDLQRLSTEFNKLKAYLASLPTIEFQEHMAISTPIIRKIPEDVFEMYAGNVQIKDHGQLVQHGPSISHAVVRGSGEYSSGKHRLQFKIETFNINKWIFFGIISHKTTMYPNTWAIPSCYGWGGQDSTILNCAMHAGLNGYSCDFELNDIIELLLDCDHQIIRLTNQRTNRAHIMNIDLVKCPFPWHFLINLFYPRDQVRILFTDT